MRLRRVTTLLAGLVLAAAGSLLAAGPANAYDYYVGNGDIATCPAGDFCISANDWGFGTIYGWFGTDRDWYRNDGGGAGPNNKDRSWYNNGTSGLSVVVFKYGNGGSGNPSTPTVCLRRGYYADFNYTNTGGALNQGSAHVWSSSCQGAPAVGGPF
jgi:hypothetical protein